MPTTASHVKPDCTAALNRKNLPIKPAVGGKPAKDSSAIVIVSASHGFRRLSPAKSAISSVPFCSLKMIITANASKFVNVYMNM